MNLFILISARVKFFNGSLARVAFVCTLLFWALSASAQIPSCAPFRGITDLEGCKAWCDTTPLKHIEGIYSFPGHNSLVQVKLAKNRQSLQPGYCEIISLLSHNILEEPGQVIGYLLPTGETTKYKLVLYTSFKPDRVSKPKEYAVTFNSAQGVLSIQKSKGRMSFNPLALLPKIGRIFRFYPGNNPARMLPEALVRIYPPVRDNTGSAPIFPIYL